MGSKIIVRKAVVNDAEHFVRIKERLPMPDSARTANGGFLLGTDIYTYLYYIEHGLVYVAEDVTPVGFGIILPDPVVRESEIWKKRHSASWTIDIEEFAQNSVCYFEQLAFLPRYSKHAVRLACLITDTAFNTGHQTLFTTTVREPIKNLAAVKFIKSAGGKHAGTINEIYPSVGKIISDLHLITAKDYFKQTAAIPVIQKIRQVNKSIK